MQTDEFQALLSCDEHHWWYVGRRRVIHAQLSRLDLPADASILDAGCGSGRMMDDLTRYGTVSGFDFEEKGVQAARSRGHGDVQQARVEEIPHEDESFDLITCLDVIEHTPDDVVSLRELHRVMRPGGQLLVTVPAYQSLWSSHDEANHHFRRYRRATLLPAATAAGWEPVGTTYFNSILFPPAAAVRLVERLRGGNRRGSESHLELTPQKLDPLLALPMRLEAALIRRGIALPFGMSLMGVLRKPAHSPNGRQVAAGADASRAVAP
jgi:2-polyprenyl-3-methyl-5-hydroxy-6-metoxy-1,4-benzoquinol methylase